MPLSRILTGVFRERRTVLACALLAAAATAAWSTFRTESYVSTGSFLIKSGGEEIDVRALVTDDAESRNRGVDNNVPHVLYSTELLRRVVQRFGAGPHDALAIEDLRQRLLIDVPKGSRLVQVSVADVSPEDARDTLRIYMEEAIRHHLAVYGDERGIEIVEREHAAAVAGLEQANQRLAEFFVEIGTAEFGAELEARRAELADAVRARQNLTRETEFESSGEPRLAGLRDQLRELENRLVDLRTRLQPNDQAIVNTTRTIGELRTRALEIAAEHREFLSTHVRERIERASAAVAELAPYEPRFQAIADSVEKCRERLTRAEAALERAHRKQMLATNQVSSLAILDSPSLPTMSEDVSRTQLTLRALAAGLFAGLGFALMRALTDKRVRDLDDLECLGAPVLATIPHLSSKHIARHNNARMIG